jgi:hypothetical protein
MVVHAYNPSTQEVEARGSRVQDQPGLTSKFEASMGYIMRLCLKKTNKKKFLSEK